MRVPFLVPALLGGAAFAAFCQTPPAPAASVPDYIIYSAFFSRVDFLDDAGAQVDAKGGDGSAARATIRKEAGLTIAEEECVKAVARKWRAQTDSFVAAGREAAGAGATPQAMQQLGSRLEQAILDLAAELQSLLGSQRFARLDGYIRATTRVRPPARRGEPAWGGR